LSQPAGAREGLRNFYDEVAAQLDAQISSEVAHSAVERSSLSAAVPPQPRRPPTGGDGGGGDLDSFQYARLLLSHLGYLPTGKPPPPRNMERSRGCCMQWLQVVFLPNSPFSPQESLMKTQTERDSACWRTPTSSVAAFRN
jgi:hypothetical protein